ncbi:unnamed protein product [Rotaria sp. Silwood1]|nr:unnamed protein product [Rotaria sp. Silwood1]CAF1534440.1 unnamed protein product [Rotaria sp. Silwood1]CAF3677890.1 unnamed protein product [Rotaria sp. Silwood1]CAF3702541.1 unnamed protein product [Rotaria sp. Silwood1]CAF4890092.1 unnamed protein product [Rotaria sp. Silwood1]
MHQVPNETMKRIPILPPSSSSSSSSMPVMSSTNNPSAQDLLWISKQQQQHPSTYAHPLKNTIRVNSRGIRYKFDGKQWRPLCVSPDGYECRNLAFRSSLCQKHFYKVHLFKRPYAKTNSISSQSSSSSSSSSSGIPPLTLKRPLPSEFEQHHHFQSRHINEQQHHHHQQQQQQQQHQPPKQQNSINDELEEIYEDDDSIEVIEDNDAIVSKQDTNQSHSEFSFFSIDCDPQISSDTSITNQVKPEPLTTTYTSRTEGITKRLDSTNTESVISNESESSSSSSINISIPKIMESIRLGIPPLTRTEEKSLTNELILQLPADASFTTGEQMARRRACEIVFDNYSHKFSLENISIEWFYDFLLRNPRIPIHFQSWFSSIKSILPLSDQLIDIKIWELGLVTRSILPSSSISTSSSSSP